MPSANSVQVTPHSRAAEFPDFHVDNGDLYCKFCCISVDYKKSSSLKSHLASKKHVKASKNPSSSRVQTIPTVLTNLERRSEFKEDFVRMCMAANIPLEKSTIMAPFLKKYCREGGSLSNPKNLRDYHVPKVTETLRKKLCDLVKAAVIAKSVFIINVDETTDEKERHVLNLVLKFNENVILLESEFLEQPVNHQSLAQFVNATIQTHGLATSFIFYVTDNTSYCLKSFSDILSRLYPRMIWVGCWAHIIDLLGDTWQSHFSSSNEILKLLRQFFKKKIAAGRRKRWKQHLRNNAIENPKFPPTANFTRWSAWLKATQYHAKYASLYASFFETELNVSKNENAQRLLTFFQDAGRFKDFEVEITFISEHCETMICLIEFFEKKLKQLHI